MNHRPSGQDSFCPSLFPNTLTVSSVLFILSLLPILHDSIAAAVEPESRQADFYVATNGSDQSPGTIDQPFATLTRARDAIRELKQLGTKRDLRVLIRGGTSRIRETVVFSLKDGAADGHTITYAAYPGETPILTPGVRLELVDG